MNIAFTYKRIALLTLLLAVAFAAIITAPKAHAEVSDEELAVLQTQVDDAAGQVQGLVAHTGKVLGASTDWASQWDNILKDIMSNGYGNWSGDDEIDKPVKKVEENSKAGLKKQIAKYNAEIERLTKLRDAAQKKLDKLASSTTATSSKKSFTITDVKLVTKKYVDPNKMMADEEYTLYTILLENGKEIKVKECGFCQDRDAAFKKAGYKGDVDALRAKATSSTDDGKTFTIKDVKSVVVKYVEKSLFDGHNVYTITLISGRVVTIKECGFCFDSVSAFRKAGYKGEISALVKLAKEETPDKNTSAKSPKFLKVTRADDTNDVIVKVYVRRNLGTSTIAVTGPISLGTIDWGDDTADETISALQGTKSIKLTHTYAAEGKYTITLTDSYGSITKKVTAGTP
jgi:hypothetical protein